MLVSEDSKKFCSLSQAVLETFSIFVYHKSTVYDIVQFQ